MTDLLSELILELQRKDAIILSLSEKLAICAAALSKKAERKVPT